MHKISIIYSWFVRTTTYFLPNSPALMRFRGFLYGIGIPSCGKNFQVASSAYFNSLTGMSIGNNVYIAHNTVIIGLDINIEDEVIIGPNSVISGGNHTFENGSFRFSCSNIIKITLKKGSWVAANCTIVGGGVLPEGSILAAGAVLTKPFADKMKIYGGIPAKNIGCVQEDKSKC
jgi:acetyltransferase-like isoleucine patch superfamily enzyme